MDLYEIFATIGFCFVFSYVASWVNILSLKLEDSGHDGAFVGNALAFLCVILYLLSLPVTVCRYFVYYIKSERRVKNALREQREKDDELLKSYERSAYRKGYEEGYRDGKETGIIIGRRPIEK